MNTDESQARITQTEGLLAIRDHVECAFSLNTNRNVVRVANQSNPETCAADLSRAVECWNACAGMADPAAEIAALRQLKADAQAAGLLDESGKVRKVLGIQVEGNAPPISERFVPSYFHPTAGGGCWQDLGWESSLDDANTALVDAKRKGYSTRIDRLPSSIEAAEAARTTKENA